MNGRELERVFDMVDPEGGLTREEVLEYIRLHKEDLLRELQETGQISIPTSSGRKLVLLPAA